ncbi:GNAT family N-acetyltransferase [Carboxylicivirga sp. M1479]|uniref:GNAT family N-acetyltransferase n=1 Tax=Carboxylicivirga sp. M1479 TaxID=2594476 RepID=UPI0011788984|nr:GNAT family N-acetyltransferase [Carboxylicivirga sp. M1479]TRX72256.1 GNAT family N-acetyltransferase [Carboxylicivirga sp. M1479]
MNEFNIFVATKEHLPYVDVVLNAIADAAKVRGTGIAKRSPEYLQKKIEEGKAVLALQGEVFAGFCYIETWGHDKFVANSGLIVVDQFRGHGLAKLIKTKAFELSRERFPNAKIFGLTTGLAVMKINSDLGYRPVTFSELTNDEQFWKGCQSCVNYDILVRTERKHCLCTGMLFDPARQNHSINNKKSSNVLSRIKKAVSKKDSKIGRTLKAITALF